MVPMSLDAEKAFNHINWEFLYKVLGQLGFHESFMAVIQALYKSSKVKSLNTNYITQKWEREINDVITNDIWFQQCAFQWKITSSNTWRCFGGKTLCG